MSNTLSETLAGLKNQATQITAADERIMAALTAAAERDTVRAEVAAATLEALPVDTAQVEGVLAQHVANLGTIETLLGKLDQPTQEPPVEPAPAEPTPVEPV